MTGTDRAPPRLGVVARALYGLGALSTASKAHLLGLVLLFYNQLVGLEAASVSLAIMIALMIDAFWDPLVGQLSDHTRTRIGRRHPYIYAAALPASVCFALIFMPPLSWGDDGVFIWLVAFLVATRLLDSVVQIPYAAQMPELSRSYDGRTNLGSWRFLFSAVIGAALSNILAFGVFLRSTPGRKYGQLNMEGYAPFAVTAAIISFAAIIISALATQRFTPYMQTPPRKITAGTVAREVRASFGNRSFLSLVTAAFIWGIGGGVAAGVGIYFPTYYWELGSTQLLWLRLLPIPGSLVGLLLAPGLARKLGKKPAYIGVAIGSIFAGTVPITLRLLGVMPPNSSPWVLRILIVDHFATAMLGTMGFVIVTSMLADVVEEIQVTTGRRSEGLLFSVDSLLAKLATSFTALLPGLMLTAVRFPRRAQPGHVSQAVLNHLALIFLPTLCGLYLCALVAISFYKIDRRRHEHNLERIAEAAALAEESDPEINLHPDPAIIPGRT